jgi:dipeptidyl aminopeptidase/acylaminoacyl peptidase
VTPIPRRAARFSPTARPSTISKRATKPILIAQGLQDVRVVAAESEQMVSALKKCDVPVTYVTFADRL